jgi:hypothetical protein
LVHEKATHLGKETCGQAISKSSSINGVSQEITIKSLNSINKCSTSAQQLQKSTCQQLNLSNPTEIEMKGMKAKQLKAKAKLPRTPKLTGSRPPQIPSNFIKFNTKPGFQRG